MGSHKKIYLKPGEWYFGDDAEKVSTLLGSCVAVILWHPVKKIGAMSHIVLPEKKGRACDMKYGCCVIDTFMAEIKKRNLSAAHFETSVYGGGNMFPHLKVTSERDVGFQNIVKVSEMLHQKGFRLLNQEVGGHQYRKVSLDLNTGAVTVQSTDVSSDKRDTD